MPTKTKAACSLEGGAPHKVSRLEVPEDRLKAELQRLLAHTDIATATVGQVRTQLESCLGLVPGALVESKHLRRLTCRMLQQEVVKKSQRSPDCEHIVRALASCNSYPDSCRQMVVEGLPNALSRNCDGALHPHQLRLLDMARDAIREEILQTTPRQKEVELKRVSAEEVLLRLQSAHDSAAKARAAASRVVEAWAEKLRDAEAKLKDVEEKLRNAREAKKKQPGLESALAEIVLASIEPLQLLMKGSWSDSDSRDLALSALEKVLTDKLFTDRSLAMAFRDALGCKPSDRSSFANAVAEAVQSAVSEKVHALQLQLQECLQAQDEAHLQELNATHESLLDKAAHKMITLADARECLEASSAVCKVQDAEVRDQAAIVGKYVTEQACVEKEVCEFNEVLSAIERLMIRTSPTPATVSGGRSDEHLLSGGAAETAGSSAGA